MYSLKCIKSIKNMQECIVDTFILFILNYAIKFKFNIYIHYMPFILFYIHAGLIVSKHLQKHGQMSSL
jgi:phenolic acid decarboxylase